LFPFAVEKGVIVLVFIYIIIRASSLPAMRATIPVVIKGRYTGALTLRVVVIAVEEGGIVLVFIYILFSELPVDQQRGPPALW